MRCALWFLLWMAVFAGAGQARGLHGRDVRVEPEHYFSANAQGVDSAAFLPPPPAQDSPAFALDKAMFAYGLSLRGTERYAQAARDNDVRRLPELFSEAFGAAITREVMPELFALMQRVSHELGKMSTRTAKRAYRRVRPYVLYNAGTCVPEAEDRKRGKGSYPSAHSACGWGVALLLSEINPGRKEILLRRGYEYGQSRVICGYHWQSDVDAGRLAGAAGLANLHANAEFLLQLQKAKEEFSRLAAAGKAQVE